MRHTDKKVAEALDVLGFKYVGRDEDNTITAYAEWPNWDEDDREFYACGRAYVLDDDQFKAIPRGYSRPLAAIEYDEEGEAYEM